MRWLWISGCLWLAAGLLGAQEAPANRLWWASFELRGPLDQLRVDCGQDGELLVELGLRAGETRQLELPLPLYSPLGAVGLAEIHLEIHSSGLGAARFLNWSSPQPNRRFESLAPGLRARSRPAAGPGKLRLGSGVVGLFLAAMLLLWATRTRWLAMLALALSAALGLGWLGTEAALRVQDTQILDLDLGLAAGLEARSGWGRLELPRERLEPQPAHAKLRFLLRLEAGQLDGEVLSPGHILVAQQAAVSLDYAPGANPGADLERVWVRTARGVWSFHGAWKMGQPLGPALANDSAPPSWLVAGLAPGRGALFGRFRGPDERWIRALGFNPR